MPTDTKEVQFYLDVLKSNGCACGREKKPGRAFCFRCWKSLPGYMKGPLYRKIGKGFELAYEIACQYLDQEVW